MQAITATTDHLAPAWRYMAQHLVGIHDVCGALLSLSLA